MAKVGARTVGRIVRATRRVEGMAAGFGAINPNADDHHKDFEGGDLQVTVKIDGIKAGTSQWEKYTGKLMEQPIDAAAGALMAASLGTEGRTVEVWNVAGVGKSGHSLKTDGTCFVTGHIAGELEDGTLVVIVGAGASSRNITVHFTSAAAGKGKYNGKSFADKDYSAITAATARTGDLAASDFGTEASEEDCIIFVPQELAVSNSGHDVLEAVNSARYALYGEGRIASVTSDGIKIVHVNYLWVGCV